MACDIFSCGSVETQVFNAQLLRPDMRRFSELLENVNIRMQAPGAVPSRAEDIEGFLPKSFRSHICLHLKEESSRLRPLNVAYSQDVLKS